MPEPTEPQVGIVVVSHSARIAEGVVELARQMAGEGVRLLAAGGMADGSLGTDAVAISEAISQADTGAGVLVVADLGSAVLSTKLAMQMIDSELAGRTRLSGGPVVEGALVAAVQASAGDSLADVLRAAEGASTMAKGTEEETAGDLAAIGGSVEPVPTAAMGTMVEAPPGTAESALPPKVLEITVQNKSGLHARPAARFVQAAARFRSRILVENLTRGTAPVNARSITDVIGSGVRQGHLIRISAQGEDDDAAIGALRSLAEAGFGEGEQVAGEAGAAAAVAPEPAGGGRPPERPAPGSTPAVAGHRIAGRPGARGIAIGPIWIYEPTARGAGGEAPAPPEQTAAEAAEAIRAAALEAASQLQDLAERVRSIGRAEEAEIFEAQAVMTSDPNLLDEAVRRVTSGEEAPAAVEAAASSVSATLAALPDELLAARAADVRDVGARIVRILKGESVVLPTVPSIAVADDLPPSIAAEIPSSLLLGIVLEGGSATAHAVILARGLGIPAVVGASGLLETAGTANSIAIDGESGEVILDPDPSEIAELAARAAALAGRKRAAAALRGRPAATADGKRVVLLANIGGPDEAARALAAGAEGVGLFRTEFLFMKRQTAPSEADQIEPYRRVFEAFGPERPVVVRLADIGGDKALPYLNLPLEANPFLGVRAIRLAVGSRELLSAQLRAIWRAAGRAGVTPHIMAPMVSTLADARLLLELRDEARAAAASSGDPLPDRMVTGVMVEVPSAAILAPELARLVDFFSIGTNDLTQYALAADRSNPALAYLQDALHPAVLRLVAGVVAGAHAAGIPVAVCGELAGDPIGALVLVGIGVDELSADAGSLDLMRTALAGVTSAQLEALARQALAATEAGEVRAMGRELLEPPGST